jgi:hypothetical protein
MAPLPKPTIATAGWRRAALAFVLLAAAACEQSPLQPSARGPTSSPPFPGQTPAGPAVLVGAGDIAICGGPGSEQTARRLDGLGGIVFTAGDNVYFSGTTAEFSECYDVTWGRHRARTRPVPGNHDYETPDAGPYFDYFGAAAGPRGLGYYSYMAGAWQVLALNSEIDVSAGSQQVQWLRRELAGFQGGCSLAIFHRPLFSSGPNGDNADLRDVWRTLHEFGVEVVVNGHDHLYERFRPQDPDGRVDQARGIRQFTVGTGGIPAYSFAAIRPNSEVRGTEWGVIVLTLMVSSYQWAFVPVEGGTFRDAGFGACH